MPAPRCLEGQATHTKAFHALIHITAERKASVLTNLTAHKEPFTASVGLQVYGHHGKKIGLIAIGQRSTKEIVQLCSGDGEWTKHEDGAGVK